MLSVWARDSAVNNRLSLYWYIGGFPVKPGDRVSLGGATGTVLRIANRAQGPRIVVEWDNKESAPTGRYFWPGDLSRL